jgi:branched-chain amino acid transport system ATP-binding protein
LLTVDHVAKRFGGVAALSDASLAVEEGQIVGLIGPNGAGKSTLFNCITRLYDWDSGEVSFLGRSVSRLKMHQIVYRGIARTFQNTLLVPRLTIGQNIALGAMVGAHRAHSLEDNGSDSDASAEMIELLSLDDVADAFPTDVPLLTKKRVEIARALTTRPRLLLLDEPATGLDPAGVTEIDALLQRLRTVANVTILLVEHNVALVAGVADSIGVLNFGRSITQGAVDEVMNDPAVIEAYLGREDEQ